MKHQVVNQLIASWNRRLWWKWALQSLSLALPLAGLAALMMGGGWPLFLSILGGTFALAFPLRLWLGFSKRATPQTMVSHLNRTLPDLQESADLLLRDPRTLNLLERLQVDLLLQKSVAQKGPLQPLRFGRTWSGLAASLFFSVGMTFAYQAWGEDMGRALDRMGFQEGGLRPAKDPPRIVSTEIEITPPAYTGLPTRFQEEELALLVEEGSQITWRLKTDQVLKNGRLVFSDQEERPLTRIQGRRYSVERTVNEGGFYRAYLTGANDLTRQSEYLKLLVKKDLPAAVQVLSPEDGAVDPQRVKTLKVITEAIDDYGFSGAVALLTVASGSGEMVTFRDSKVPINLPPADQNGRVVFDMELNFQDLGMAAGDELYLQLEVRDNREPEPNLSRSATLVVKLTGGEEPEEAEMEGIGVDRLPDYFRSQRQIIIDTEKLIGDKAELSRREFLARANNLGLDQKILRLRYGTFLGEEFSTTLGPTASLDEAAGDGHDHHGHNHGHDHENESEEENTVTLESLSHNHDHEPESIGWGERTEERGEILDNPMLVDYVHVHDQMEEATFLPEETKEKLRACLAEMWDAEKHLRLGRPDLALPYEYRALKLLKEIQQADRVYIRRTALDLPPLDPEKLRLTGELEEIETRKVEAPPLPRNEEEGIIWAALSTIQTLEKGGTIDTSSLTAAQDWFAARAETEPERYVTPLNDLMRLQTTLKAASSPSTEQVMELKRDLWQLLTEPPRTPSISQRPASSLSKAYLEQLTQNSGIRQ